MTPMALVFLILSWTFVLGLTAWSFARVLGADAARRRREQQGGAAGKNK